uniref:Chemokine interleukin-8-like domain-containing protein n=1 Tax=Strix occidentalis caurina TaxID=311401 RepID=A0A8D0EMY2_STROC
MKVHAAAILVIFWLGIFTEHTVKGSIGSQSMSRLKCVNLPTQQLHIRNLVSYEKRQGPLNAIIFMTTRGVKVCVSSNQEWVQTAIKKIDQKRATKGN